jgi:hypothetical protein
MITYCQNPDCPDPDKPIIWFYGRPPQYCSPSCKMSVYRLRKRAEQLAHLRMRWQFYCPHAVELLEALYKRYGLDAALAATEAFEAEFFAISG